MDRLKGTLRLLGCALVVELIVLNLRPAIAFHLEVNFPEDFDPEFGEFDAIGIFFELARIDPDNHNWLSESVDTDL